MPALALLSAGAWAAEPVTSWTNGDLTFKATTLGGPGGDRSKVGGSVQIQRQLNAGQVQLDYTHRQERQDGQYCAVAGGNTGCVFDPLYRNGQDTDTLGVLGELRPSDRFKTTARAQWHRGVSDLDDPHVDRREVTRRLIDAKSEFKVNEHVSLATHIKDQWDQGDESSQGERTRQWQTLQSSREMQAHWTPSKSGRMSIGWSETQDMNVRGDDRSDARRVDGWFANWRATLSKKLGLTGRFAQKNHSDFGEQDESQVTLTRQLDGGRHLTASARSTYRVPSLYELNFPNRGDLGQTPERWNTMQTTFSGKDWSLNAALHRVSSQRDIESDPVRGVELGSSYRHGDLTLRTNVTSFDVTGPDGLQLPHRVHNSGRIMVDKDMGRATVGLTVNGFSKRYLDAANQRVVNGHARVDVRTGFDITDKVRLDAGLSNVFNQRSETVGWYDQPGRQLQFNFRITQ